MFHFGGKTIKEVQNEILNHKQKHVIETQAQPRCTHKFNQAHMGKHKKILHGSWFAEEKFLSYSSFFPCLGLGLQVTLFI